MDPLAADLALQYPDLSGYLDGGDDSADMGRPGDDDLGIFPPLLRAPAGLGALVEAAPPLPDAHLGEFVEAAPSIYNPAVTQAAWSDWRDDWSMRYGTSLSRRTPWAWSSRWGLPVHTPALSGLGAVGVEDIDAFGLGDFGISAAATGIIAAIAAGVSVAGGAAGAISKIVKSIRENEHQEIKDARAGGASPSEIQKIRRKFRKQKQKARRKHRKARRAGRKNRKRGGRRVRRTSRKARSEKARRSKTMPSKAAPPPEEVLRQMAAGALMAGDILHRTGMGVEEIQHGAAIDPWTGARVRTATKVVPMPLPVGPGVGPLAFLSRPVVAGIPLWGVLAGVAGVVFVGGAVLRRR